MKSKKLVSYVPNIGDIGIRESIPNFVQDGILEFKQISDRDENTKLLLMIKEFIKGIIPRFLLNFYICGKLKYKVFLNYMYDYKRYKKYSATLQINNENKYEGRIVATYHVLEKGLSLPKPRPGFGQAEAKSLLNLLETYKAKGYNFNNTQVQSACSVLQQYIKFQKRFSIDVNETEERLKSLKIDIDPSMGGTRKITSNFMIINSKGDFKKLAESRCSIRNYSDIPINLKTITAAIKIAQKTPSVCNRQASRVYIIDNKKDINNALDYQTGNRGFGHLFDKLLIITSDLYVFAGPSERYQNYIDGGMFCMSLLYALQYYGLGTCSLNWSVDRNRDIAMRSNLGISDNENIIMYIGVGHLPEVITVANSNRKKTEDIIYYKNSENTPW